MPTTGFPAGQHLAQRKPGLRNKNRLQLGDRRGERRLVGQQLPAHPGPLRALPGVHEHRARPARPLMRGHHPGPGLARGQRPQPGHRLGTITRTHRGELRLPGPVMVQRVRHIGQPAPARRRPPSSRPTPPAHDATRSARLARHHQRGHRRRRRRRSRDRVPGPARSPHAHSSRRNRTTTPRPDAAAPGDGQSVGSGNDFQPHRLRMEYAGFGSLEVQIRRNVSALHRQHRLDETRDAGRGLQMTEIGLHRPISSGEFSGRPRP